MTQRTHQQESDDDLVNKAMLVGGLLFVLIVAGAYLGCWLIRNL